MSDLPEKVLNGPSLLINSDDSRKNCLHIVGSGRGKPDVGGNSFVGINDGVHLDTAFLLAEPFW